MTSAARDLMDTGTPGPWTKRTAWSVADALHHEDARKIVLSVNALPLVDALCEALASHAEARATWDVDGEYRVCYDCGHDWPCPVAAARDALEAALRGEGDG